MTKYVKQILKGNYLLFGMVTVTLFFLSLDGIIAPHFLGQFTDYMTHGDFNASKQTVLLWLFFLLMVVLAKGLFSLLSRKMIQRINNKFKSKLAQESVYIDNLQKEPSQYVSIITSEMYQIENKFINNIYTLILCGLQGIITFIFLMRIDVVVGLLFVGLGAIPSIIPQFTSSWLKEGTENWQQKNVTYINFLTDFLNARVLMKRFEVIQQVFKKLTHHLSQAEHKYYTMHIRQAVINTIISVLYVCTLLVALFFGIESVQNGRMTVGALMTIYLAADRVISPLITAVKTYNELQSAEPMMKPLFISHGETEATKKIIQDSGQSDLIRLQNVTIGYAQYPLIQDIEFSVVKGDKILFKASSGAGKTTFFKTILGEQPALKGEIYYTSPENIFAVIEQHPFIFDDTVEFNLTFGMPMAREQLITVLHQVGLHQLATEAMLSSSLNKSSTQLSGGELKRLEIARALLFKKPFLLVDEAISGLDDASAKELNQLIKDYPGTIIDIEHHISEEMMTGYNKVITVKDTALVVQSIGDTLNEQQVS